MSLDRDGAAARGAVDAPERAGSALARHGRTTVDHDHANGRADDRATDHAHGRGAR